MKVTRLLEKTLKDIIKEKKYTLGIKKTLTTLKNSRLIILSKSINGDIVKKVQHNAKKEKVPIIKIENSSMALGKLCGFQFRVSALSISYLNDQNIKLLLKEYELQ